MKAQVRVEAVSSPREHRRRYPGDHESRGRRHRLGPVIIAGLTVALAGIEMAVAAQAEPTPGPREQVWLGPDGAPLPFGTDDEVLEFLGKAAVVSRRTLKEGINHEQKVLLELDGLRAHAIFRTVDFERRRLRMYGRYHHRFVDHYGGECAAYELARRLGLGFVPPTVPRRLDGSSGSLQLWVEGARDETAEDFRTPQPMAWVKQVWDRSLFDNLILNVDRNPGNILAGPDYRLWLYDHGQAFQPQGELLAPEAMQKVNRGVWERLEAMSDDDLRDVVREHLDTAQVDALVKRRALLVERVEALLKERGEGTVFY